MSYNQKDIVPALPPRKLGYQHVPREYWFQNTTKYWRKCDGSGEDPTCHDSVLSNSITGKFGNFFCLL